MSHNERAHAKLSGSIAHIWSECWGAPALWAQLPPSGPSEAALLGTTVHEICEHSLRDFLNWKVTGIQAPTVWMQNYDDAGLNTAADYVKAVWEKVLQQSLTGKAWGIEEEVCLDRDLEMYGIVDFWVIYIDDRGRRVLAVMDFKNGFHYVEVPKNAQFLFYACSMLQEMRQAGKDLDYIRLCKFQPNTAHGDAYEEAGYTAAQVDKWKAKFFKAAKQILGGSAKLKVGKWCRWCQAQAICPAYGRSISDEASLALMEADKIQLPNVERISDGQLKALILYGDMVTDFIESVRKYAIGRVKDGKPIEGLKLINGPTRRTWRDQEQEIAKALTLCGVKEPWQRKLITITSAEKQVGKEALRDLVTTTKPSIRLVSAQDPRPAIADALSKLGETDDGKQA